MELVPSSISYYNSNYIPLLASYNYFLPASQKGEGRDVSYLALLVHRISLYMISHFLPVIIFTLSYYSLIIIHVVFISPYVHACSQALPPFWFPICTLPKLSGPTGRGLASQIRLSYSKRKSENEGD